MRCHILWHLIWVYSVCSGLSIQIHVVKTVNVFTPKGPSQNKKCLWMCAKCRFIPPTRVQRIIRPSLSIDTFCSEGPALTAQMQRLVMALLSIMLEDTFSQHGQKYIHICLISPVDIFFLFLYENMGTHVKRGTKALLMSTHNMFSKRNWRNSFMDSQSFLQLWGSLLHWKLICYWLAKQKGP